MAQLARFRSPLPSRHEFGDQQRPFLRGVAQTAATNVLSTALAGGAGLLLAAQLGASQRGHYAAVQSWFGILTIVGELGMPAAVCYFVARNPARAADWLATSCFLLLGLGLASAAVGLSLTPLLAKVTRAPLTAYVAVFSVMPAMFVAGAWSFALQAKDITLWNLVRLITPTAYATGIVALGLARRLTVVSAAATLVTGVMIQGVAAYVVSHRMVAKGRPQRKMVRPLLGFAVSSLSGRAPYAFNARIDQVLLAMLVSSGELGNYAVAVSLTLLAAPLSSAFGNVVMPSLARNEGEDQKGKTASALRGALLVGCLIVSVVVVAAQLLAVRVLGPSYGDVPLLVALLAPGAILLGANQVLGDILRGLGRPLDAGRGEAGGLVVTAVLLATLVPRWGARGAAVASTVAYSVSFLLLLRQMVADTKATSTHSRGLAVESARRHNSVEPTGHGWETDQSG